MLAMLWVAVEASGADLETHTFPNRYTCNTKVANFHVTVTYTDLTPNVQINWVAESSFAVQDTFTTSPTGNGTRTFTVYDICSLASSGCTNLIDCGIGIGETDNWDGANFTFQAWDVAHSPVPPWWSASGGRTVSYAHILDPMDLGYPFPTEHCTDPSATLVTYEMRYVMTGISNPPDDDSHKCVDEKAGGDACNTCKGMAGYTANLMTASLRITDTPLSYTPPLGPAVNFTVTYNQRDSDQSPAQAYSNFGPNWTFNWLSYVTDDPNAPSSDARVYVPGGGTETYREFDPNTQSYRADPQSRAVLVRTSADPDPIAYEKRFPDGSKEVFEHSNGSSTNPRLIFLTQIVDALGNAVRIQYKDDNSNRIDKIFDAVGNPPITFTYGPTGDINKIMQVTDPFGRSAILDYYPSGQLKSITDPVGIVSGFEYETGTNFINELTTPYGHAFFDRGESGPNRWLNMTDPRGAMERVEYRYATPDIIPTDPTATVPAGSEFVNSNLHLRNSYYWDKKTLSLYPPVGGVHGLYDYTKAKITHWLRTSDGTMTSGIVASEKMPLENRVWHIYPEQPDDSRVGPKAQPSEVARVLGDGTTQRWQYQYNSLGNVTKTTDPVGRVFSNVYWENEIDVKEKRQTRGLNSELLRSTTYNSLHEPLIDTDAAGQTTTYTYRQDGHGQLQSVQNAKFETTTYMYGPAANVPADYLASITSPQFNGTPAIASFTYDNANRVHTVTTSPDGYFVTTDYDDLDRPTLITYPDSTTRQFKYTEYTDQGDTGKKLLDLTQAKDRLDRWTYRHYDGNRRMDWIKDPLDRKTIFDWCTCGALSSITDANSNVTRFDRDLQSRVYQKVFADNTAINYLYEGQTGSGTAGATSRLKSTTDAKGQRTNYSYFQDDDVAQITYTDTAGAPLYPVTPTVLYVYDQNYNRPTSMSDGTGTTGYEYYPVTVPGALGAGRLKNVDGPLDNDTITYGYDALGRMLSQSINGVGSSVDYDVLGRVSASDNDPLGHFTRTYDGVTARPLSVVAAQNGQVTNYHYFGGTADRHLQYMENLTTGGTNLSRFDYTYDAEGEIASWSKTLGTGAASALWFSYDDAQQLRSAQNTANSNIATYENAFEYR